MRSPTLTRLNHGGFVASIVNDRRDPSIWIYAVQKLDEAEIVAMGSATSREEGLDLAVSAMKQLHLEDRALA